MRSRDEKVLTAIGRDALVIEVRPGADPIAPKADGWNSRTVDHLPREALAEKYAGHHGVDVEQIEEVNYLWSRGSLIDAVPPAARGTFDALIAGHVIAQIPDLIDFLDSAAALLKPEGVVALAIPDKRYCFDYFQPLTTTGQLLEAHATQDERYIRRLVFEHYAYAVGCRGEVAWGQHPLPPVSLMYSIEHAHDQAEAAAPERDHSDLRTWRFTPASFQLLLLDLARLGHTDWRIERSTEADGSEFLVWLRRGGRIAAALPEEVFAGRRLALLKRTLLETRAQIDWLLASEPELVTGPLGLLPAAVGTAELSLPAVGPEPEPPAEPNQAAPRYVDWPPARENAGRAFAGEWSSAVPGLPDTGNVPLFQDPRIIWFEDRLGGFDLKRVLELGPLEGGHTYMMTQRGATVTAIKSNTRAWMRCVVVKDVLDMFGATFLLGDFVRYLRGTPQRFDFLLASGVLYHMTDPVEVLHNLCRTSDAIGLWTHYFDPGVLQTRSFREKFDFKPQQFVTPRGRTVELYGQRYLQALEWSGFCGGSAPGSNWLRRQDILGVLDDEGFATETFQDQPEHPNGPAFCVFARRRPTGG